MAKWNIRFPTMLVTFIIVCYFELTNLSFSQTPRTPQTHDVPMFHNDDGLALLQDCTFMRAIAVGEITEIPTTVAGRSTSCLASIKSVAQVIYSIQRTANSPTSCLPSADLDWFDVLEFVTTFMETQSSESLPNQPYGVWIMQALQEKYACK